MPIRHFISKDGLKLTSTALINGKDAVITVTWKNEEKAERNYANAMNAAEKRFKTLAANRFTDDGESNNSIKKLVNLGGIQVTGGVFKGNSYDNVRVTFGTHSWVAEVVNGHTIWQTLHSDPLPKKDRFLVGFGGKTSAIFLSFENKKK